MRTYYAHPVSDYDTPYEKQCLIRLRALGMDITNPNEARHSEGYSLSGMAYFMDAVLPGCKAGCVFSRFPDGRLGAGVFKEILYFLSVGLPVNELTSDGLLTSYAPSPIGGMSVSETRVAVKFYCSLPNGGRG